MTREPRRDVPIDPGADSGPASYALLGRTMANDPRTRPILEDSMRTVAGFTGAFTALPSNLRAGVVAMAEALRRAGLVAWNRSGPAMQTRSPIDEDHYEHRWWSGPNLTGQALIRDPGWRDKPGPMITDGEPYPTVWCDDDLVDDDDLDEPVEWHDDIAGSWDAHTVTADDYDDPDSMINRIDRALALHQGDVE